MDIKEKRRLEELTGIFKALAHPARLWMVEQLFDGEKCVCEFVEVLKLDFSTVSKHLSILKNACVVEDEKRGKNVYYSLRKKCLPHIISCLTKQDI
ncbi:MAG: metalloregulator ArsR/SmtB family transcription factor [Candidatus Neomarinimicrobiota bacterium]|jgi:ArsR family transcriptional regulator